MLRRPARSARAVHTRGHIMTLSNAASQPIEGVVAARGGPVRFQLYRDPTAGNRADDERLAANVAQRDDSRSV